MMSNTIHSLSKHTQRLDYQVFTPSSFQNRQAIMRKRTIACLFGLMLCLVPASAWGQSAPVLTSFTATPYFSKTVLIDIVPNNLPGTTHYTALWLDTDPTAAIPTRSAADVKNPSGHAGSQQAANNQIASL